MTWKQALLKSIEKWDGICFNHDDIETECQLCIRAGLENHENANCNLCPIGTVTGKVSCYGTPYYDVQDDVVDAEYEMYLFLCFLYHEYYGDD
jgi:hypothetical protein